MCKKSFCYFFPRFFVIWKKLKENTFIIKVLPRCYLSISDLGEQFIINWKIKNKNNKIHFLQQNARGKVGLENGKTEKGE